MALNLMDLNDDILHVLCSVAALLHPPHWGHYERANYPHDWKPNVLSSMFHQTIVPTYCLGWIYLSHVNRRLRQICFDSPILWANIITSLPSASTDVMSTLLSRARGAPLSLSIPMLDWRASAGSDKRKQLSEENRAKVAFSISHLSHAVALKVDSSHIPFDIDWCPVFDNRPLSQLRYLTLPRGPITQPQRLVSITAPNLVELYMTSRFFPLVTTSMNSLLRLEIGLNRGRAHLMEHRNGDPILNILRCTPVLEELNLHIGSSNTVVEEDGDLREGVKLARLQKATVRIQGLLETCAIWSRIEAPELVQLKFSLEATNHRDDPTLALRSICSQLTRPTHGAIKLTETVFGLTLEVRPLDGDADEGVSLKCQSIYYSFVRNTLVALPGFVVASNIKRLNLVPFVSISRDDPALSDFMRSFPAVTELVFEGESLDIS